MNGKIPHSRTDWTFPELIQYGFSPYEYCVFKNKRHQVWFDLFGDKFFTVPKMFCESASRMDYEDYSIIIDEMSYIDVIYNGDGNSKIPYEVLLSGRRTITMVDMFSAIKYHKRERTLKSLEDELA